MKRIDVILYLPDDATILDVVDKMEEFKREFSVEMVGEVSPRLVDTVHNNFGEPVEKYYYSKFRVITLDSDTP